MRSEHEPDDVQGEAVDGPDEQSGQEKPDVGSRRGRWEQRGAMWEFFHPGKAAWSAPGEGRARSAAGQLEQRMQRSRGLRVVIAVAAIVLVVLAVSGVWALTRPTGPGEPGLARSSSASEDTAEDSDARELPGAQGPDRDDESAAGEAGETAASGREADDEDLDQINDGDGLISAEAEHADDPLVTGARFLRSLRSTDTTEHEVTDWYAARDSFLAAEGPGRMTDWGEAGEDEAISSAEISWAEMDAAIEDGRGIAPDFPYGPDVEPGSHLVQVGMRLDREVTVNGQTVQRPAGALMEAVVVCPQAEGVDRCVVIDWAEEPAQFTASVDEAWEVSP